MRGCGSVCVCVNVWTCSYAAGAISGWLRGAYTGVRVYVVFVGACVAVWLCGQVICCFVCVDMWMYVFRLGVFE